MTNPVIRLVEEPTAALADLGWAFVLLAALLATWWALGRNIIYLTDRYQDGWMFLVPLQYAARSVVLLLIIAVDLWLIAGIVHVLGA
jgi:hypothetical protein